jgi:hypothetical protein
MGASNCATCMRRVLHGVIFSCKGERELLLFSLCVTCVQRAIFKEKHCVWDPIPLLTITSPSVNSKHVPWATLCLSRP